MSKHDQLGGAGECVFDERLLDALFPASRGTILQDCETYGRSEVTLAKLLVRIDALKNEKPWEHLSRDPPRPPRSHQRTYN